MKKILKSLLLVAGFTLMVSHISFADEPAAGKSKETTEQAISSGTVTLNVKSALLGTKGIDSNKIKVISNTSQKDPTLAIVTLTGTQKSKKLVKLAGKVARNVEGVGGVHNQLKVSKKD